METTDLDQLQQEFQEIDGKPSGLRWGAIAGVVVVVYGLVRYLIDIEVYISWGWAMASYLFVIAGMVMAAVEVKNRQQNYISFKKALQASFLASVVSLIIMTIFSGVMAEVVDPNITKFTKAKSLEFTEQMLEKTGASEEKIEEELERVEKSEIGGIRQYLMLTAWQIFVGFFYALVISGIFHFAFKGNKPVPHLMGDINERAG